MLTKSVTARIVVHYVDRCRRTAGRRCLIFSSLIALVCITLAAPALARGVPLIPNGPVMARGGDAITSLPPSTVLRDTHLQQLSEPVQLVSFASEWRTFVKKTRIKRLNSLPRSVARSLRRLDPEKWWPASKRRKSDPRNGDPIPRQNSQIEIERVPIPQPRPSGTIRDNEAGSVIAAPAVTRLADVPSSNRLFISAAALCLVLMAGYLAHYASASTILSRKRIRSEEALDNAIANLSQEAPGSEQAVGRILDCVEEVLGMSAACLVVFDPETVTIQSIYSSQTGVPSKDGFVNGALVELPGRSGPLKDQTLWHYPKAFDEASDDHAEPIAVTSVAWNGTRTGVMITAQCKPGRCTCATDANTLKLVTQTIAKVINGRLDTASFFASSVASDTMLDTREQLAGALAHEFNNLLMPIMGYAEMAADALNPDSYPRTYVERIRNAGERAKRVVEQILAFSRQQQNSYGSFDVVAATAEILPDLKMFVPTSTNFRVRLPDGPVRLRGDAITLQQAILNLCKNAGEAVGDDCTITVGVTVIQQTTTRNITHGCLTPRRYVRVSVSDTGAGIPATDQRQIFDPFFTTRGDEGGTGLGLPMVLRAIKLLDGCINVRSSPSRGTRFDLFLPYPALHSHEDYDATKLRDHVGKIAAI